MAQVTGVNTTWNTTAGNKGTAPTPNAGEQIIAIVGESGLTTGFGVSDNQPGGSYTQIGTFALNNTSVDALAVFVRDNPVQVSTAYSINTTGAGTSTGGGIHTIRVAGLPRFGVEAVRVAGGTTQFVKAENQAAGTPSLSLPVAPLATSLLIGAVLDASNSTANTAPPTGWTEQADAGYNTPPTGLEVATVDSGVSANPIAWTAATPTGFAAIVIELDTTPPAIALPPVGPMMLTPRISLFGPIIRAFQVPRFPATPYFAQDIGGGSVAISGSGGANEAAGQAFTLTDDVVVNQVELMLSIQGTPTDDLVLEVLSGSITGTVLDSVTRSVDDLTATPAWAVFGTEVSLTAGTYYLRLSRVGARDISNRVKWERATTDLIAGLDRYSEDSGVWTSLPTEHTFRIYGPFTPSTTHTFFITPSGATTPAGALAKLTTKPLAGATTPAGSLTKLDLKPLTGATTPVGASQKLVSKPLSGASTPAGALTKKTLKAFASASTPSGALTKLVSKLLTGASTPTGVLTTLVVKLRTFTGATTPTGALLKLIAKPLAGATTPAGAVTKQIGKPLTGSTTPTGALSKRANKSFAGAVTPTGTGTFSRLLLRSFAGAVTSSGTVKKAVARTFAGSSTPTGSASFTRVFLRLLSGSTTPVGNLLLTPVRVAKTIGAFARERWSALAALRWTATSRDRWRP